MSKFACQVLNYIKSLPDVDANTSELVALREMAEEHIKQLPGHTIRALLVQMLPSAPDHTITELGTIILAAVGNEEALKFKPDGAWSDAGCVLFSYVSIGS